MENKFYTDNFEQLLKESTDNFRMYPSKRVWHSIYNNLHPSRKWPSLAIWVLFISSTIYIGLSNKNQFASSNSNVKITASDAKQLIATNSTTAIINLNNSGEVNPFQPLKPLYKLNNISSEAGNKKSNLSNTKNTQQSATLTAFNNQSPNPENTAYINTADKNLTGNTVAANATKEVEKDVVTINNINAIINSNEKEPAEQNLITKKVAADIDIKKKVSVTGNDNTDKEWIEDFAFHNKPLALKWRSHATYQLYFTPSIGYRVLSKNTNLRLFPRH